MALRQTSTLRLLLLAGYSSPINFPSVGLYFSGFAVFARTSCEGLGEPTRSRAISRTVTAAENVFFLRFFAMKSLFLIKHSRSGAAAQFAKPLSMKATKETLRIQKVQ